MPLMLILKGAPFRRSLLAIDFQIMFLARLEGVPVHKAYS
jgi:hypothetical protein